MQNLRGGALLHVVQENLEPLHVAQENLENDQGNIAQEKFLLLRIYIYIYRKVGREAR